MPLPRDVAYLTDEQLDDLASRVVAKLLVAMKEEHERQIASDAAGAETAASIAANGDGPEPSMGDDDPSAKQPG